MIRIFLVILACLLLPSTGSFAAEIKILEETSTSWDGVPLQYPTQEKALITAVHITLAPNETMKMHCHPIPTLAYMISGKIRVHTGGKLEKTFEKGDVIIEVVNTWHYGKNLLQEPAELIVFYTGEANLPTTLHFDEKHKDDCKP